MTVKLERIDEFRKVLENYQPNSRALQIMQEIPLGIFQGITGAGKNTIINRLINMGGYHYIVSDTTRPPKIRDGQLEQEGIHYNFRSEDSILQDLNEGLFLEAEIIHDQQVSGINIRELEKAHQSGLIPINEVDIGGTLSILSAKPDTSFFFIVPPSYDEWMERLLGREVMSETEQANRLKTAITVLEKGLQSEHLIFVVNQSSKKSAILIDEYLKGQTKAIDQSEAIRSAEQILKQLKAHSY